MTTKQTGGYSVMIGDEKVAWYPTLAEANAHYYTSKCRTNRSDVTIVDEGPARVQFACEECEETLVGREGDERACRYCGTVQTAPDATDSVAV